MAKEFNIMSSKEFEEQYDMAYMAVPIEEQMCLIEGKMNHEIRERLDNPRKYIGEEFVCRVCLKEKIASELFRQLINKGWMARLSMLNADGWNYEIRKSYDIL